MGQVVEMKRPRPATGAERGIDGMVAHAAENGKVLMLPRVYVCPACGAPAPIEGKRERVRGRWLLRAIRCQSCGMEYEIREDLADADARTKRGWGA